MGHLIYRDIGGADDIENLWPQCREPINKDKSTMAHTKKDRLEIELKRRVCETRSDTFLKEYQRKITENWVDLYHEIYGEE
jgi:hypothetical protein